jgi:hypothetical protein
VAGASAAARTRLASATGAARLEPLLVLGVAEFGAAHDAAALAAFAEAQSIARGLARAPADSGLGGAWRVLTGGAPPPQHPGDSP